MLLPGTSALRITARQSDADLQAVIDSALEYRRGLSGDLTVIAGEWADGGEDPGETVIRGAVVIAVLS